MNYIKKYYSNSRCRGNGSDFVKITGMGWWRSRWERYREVYNSTVSDEKITRIYTKRTPKDFVVTSVRGRTNDDRYFKIVPAGPFSEEKKSQFQKKDFCSKKGKRCKSCLRSDLRLKNVRNHKLGLFKKMKSKHHKKL